MATATKKNTSLVKNTARQVTLKGNAAKPATRRNTTKTNAARHHRPVRSKRRSYRHNSAATATAGLLAAFGGALVINSFDMVINRFVPSLSGMLRTVSKFGLGFLVGMYGEKIPLVKGFAPTIRNALYLAGALDVVGTYLMPKITELLSNSITTVTNAIAPAATVVATAPVTNKATGELGRVLQLSNGSTVEVYGGAPNWRNQNAFAF